MIRGIAALMLAVVLAAAGLTLRASAQLTVTGAGKPVNTNATPCTNQGKLAFSAPCATVQLMTGRP